MPIGTCQLANAGLESDRSFYSAIDRLKAEISPDIDRDGRRMHRVRERLKGKLAEERGVSGDGRRRCLADGRGEMKRYEAIDDLAGETARLTMRR